MADVADRAFAQVEIRRLERAHRAAVIARIQADVQCGMHRAVVGELEQLVNIWPDDETVRVLLVICLFRSGRVVEASLACTAAVRAALDNGLDSRSLAALQLDVLNGTLLHTGVPHLPMTATFVA
jgi:hypothetical protein